MTRERPGLSFPASKHWEHEQGSAHRSNTFAKMRAASGPEPSCRVKPPAPNTPVTPAPRWRRAKESHLGSLLH